ncbi:MAG: 2Fe-2S iron-sulfur cluster binding domain-containing protein [Nitrospinota bacterium]|nr:2Fe-2S iron-sulfur cluster binding domain-containing protein [Nitrospinota bacterium]
MKNTNKLKVNFEKENRTIEVGEGENLREAAIRNKFSIYPHVKKILNCRGRGLCTACTVQVLAGKIEARNETESDKLSKKPDDFRMACQFSVTDNLVIRTNP